MYTKRKSTLQALQVSLHGSKEARKKWHTGVIYLPTSAGEGLLVYAKIIN